MCESASVCGTRCCKDFGVKAFASDCWSCLFACRPDMSAVNPPRGLLAKQLEAHEIIRHRLVEKPWQVMVRWPSKETVGVASVKAMKLNTLVLEVAAHFWTACCPFVKTIPIDLLRSEVGLGFLLCLLLPGRCRVCWDSRSFPDR